MLVLGMQEYLRIYKKSMDHLKIILKTIQKEKLFMK